MHDKRPDGAERLMLPPGGEIPNNQRLPVLLHRAALPAGDPGAAEALFASHGWPPAWRNGIYDYHHYHPNAHEALAIAAGTGHRNLGASPDLLVVGAYPPGAEPEEYTGLPGESERAAEAIPATPDPPSDPVTGRPYPGA